MKRALPILIVLLFLGFSALYKNPSVKAASSWQKYSGNPILRPSTAGWDGRHVAQPLVIFKDNIYRMWLQGMDGSRWRIGYATALDGINNWSRRGAPVLDLGSTDGWENETVDPTVLFVSGKYKMWYTSLNAGWASGGPDRMRVRYAESDDGIIWARSGWIMYGTPGQWDSGGIVRGRSVIYKDSVYHMWYTGTNENSVYSAPYWRIGYATSTDGLNWTKQNNGNPVIEPTKPWELNNVSFPNVIYENGMYHMWYAGGSWDAPTQFAYAYSYDGINWIKPADQNPVLTLGSGGSFDSQLVTQPFVMHDGDLYKMWYSGWNGSNWAIGYATTSAIFGSPTPTPTRTPTPTPSPSPTPTPTAGPLTGRKVVVVPGLGGSWNRDALLNCKLDNYSGNWTSWKKSADVYAPFLAALLQAGFTPKPFYYDWRKPVTDTAPSLSNFIKGKTLNGNTITFERVHLVGHSLGGLVGRAYLEQAQYAHRLDKFMTIGSPHRGTVLAYPAWSGGKVWGDLAWRMSASLLKVICQLRWGWTEREVIQLAFPSIQNLLPIFNYLKDAKSGQIKPVGTMVARNNWLPTSFASPFFGATVGALSGTGTDTLRFLRVQPPNATDSAAGNWLDGKPTQREFVTHGDGTVLAVSSQLSGADNRLLPLDHNSLISQPTGIAEILDFLGIGGSSTVSVQPSQPPPQSALLIVSDDAGFQLFDPTGSALSDSDGQITLITPKDGTYTLRISPYRWTTRLFIFQFLSDGRTLWKEYKFTGILPYEKTLRLNQTQPVEDILY